MFEVIHKPMYHFKIKDVGNIFLLNKKIRKLTLIFSNESLNEYE